MSIQLDNFSVPKATLQQILDFLPYPFLLSQMIDGIRTNIYVNAKFLEEIGYQCAEMPTIDDWFVLAYPDPKYRNQIITEWESLATQPNEFVVMRAKIATKVNGNRWYEVKSSIFSDIHMVSFVSIDDVMLRDQELERSSQNKDKMLSILGHDLRSPIINLQSITRLALDSNITKEEFANLLTLINEKSFQVLEFLDTTLQWTKSNFDKLHLQKKEIDVADIFNSIFPVYKTSGDNKKIKISMSNTQSHKFYSDPEIITIVLRNLLSNAIKFTPEGGNILVKTEGTDKTTTISVVDSGRGVTREMINQILNENYTSQNGTGHEKGLGIGLKLCNDLLRKIKGELHIESTPGKGTTVKVVIPHSDL